MIVQEFLFNIDVFDYIYYLHITKNKEEIFCNNEKINNYGYNNYYYANNSYFTIASNI